MFPFSGAFVAILVTSVVLILPAEVQTAGNKEIEEEEQKLEVGLRSIQQNFAYIARLLQEADPRKKGGAPQFKRQVGSILFPPASTY